MTGTGSSSKPYVVNSTKGFYYISKLNLDSKYIVLNCDIYLNDETFDENGNPSGGDGVVYNWQPVKNAWHCNIEGNGHSIRGFYLNTTNQYGSLFGNTTLSLCQNLNFENVYLSSTAFGLCTLAWKCDYIYNLDLSGTIEGYQWVLGLVNVAKEMEGCNNFADVSATTSYASGLVFSTTVSAKNCNNYGNIKAVSAYAGGIIGGDASVGVVENCNNYGNVTSSKYTGGVVSSCYSMYAPLRKLIIRNCNNYGKIVSGSAGGGIIGYSCGITDIINCKNEGLCFQTTTDNNNIGGIIGFVYNNSREGKNRVNIVNCQNKVDANYNKKSAVIGVVEMNSTIFVSHLMIEYDNYNGNCLFNYLGNGHIVEIQNVYIKINSSMKDDISLIGNVNKAGDNKISAKNILVESETQVQNVYFVKTISNYDSISYLNSCLFVFADGKGVFHGDEFSEFFYSNKHGKFGIQSLHSLGGFQVPVTEDWLLNKGFVKKNLLSA